MRFPFLPIVLVALFSLIHTVFPSGTLAQDTKKIFTLKESVEEAFRSNWTFKSRKERIDQAQSAKKQARANFLPKLSTSYGYTRFDEEKRSDPVSLGALGSIPGRKLQLEDNYQWKTTISQPLFAGFSIVSAYELAKLGIDQAKLEVAQQKLDLALSVKESYFNILKSDKAVEVARDAVESLESNVKVAKSFYKVGMIPINDLLKAEVELANAKQGLVKATNAARFARAAFNIVLSRPITSEAEVEDVRSFTPERGDLNSYVEEAIKKRPEIVLLDVNIKQTDQQIRISESSYYPEVSLMYDYIQEGDEWDVDGSEVHDRSRWQAMAVLSWNIWEWGKTHYSSRENQALKRELILARAAIEDQIRLELENALLALDEAEKNIPTTSKAVEQGEENLRVSEERYKAQVTTITEVLDAQTLLTQARTNYYNALYDHHLARARLERALGSH